MYHILYMYICIYVYICVYIIYIYRYVCLYVYICMYVCIYVCIYVCMYICMYVCMYMYFFISFPQLGSSLGNHLELLLRSVLSKMQRVHTPSVMQSLITVFAHLSMTQLELVLSFLSQVPDPSGRPALEFVLLEWCDKHVSVT